MNMLRRAHLLLGCFFAPMLAFFSISGLWQLLVPVDRRAPWLQLAGSLHTGRSLKAQDGVLTLASGYTRALAAMMAVALLTTLVIGVALAFKSGRGRIVLATLVLGIAVPVSLVLLTVID